MADLAAAAFRTGPFDVTARGHIFTFPHLSAAEWMDLLSRNTWPVEVTMAMDDDSYERFLDLIESGSLTGDDIPVIAHAALSGAGGRNWWEVAKLCNTAVGGDGRMLGSLTLAGADPQRITLAAFCAAVWARLTENASETDRMKAEAELTLPPPDATPDEMEGWDDGFQDITQLRNMPGVRIG